MIGKGSGAGEKLRMAMKKKDVLRYFKNGRAVVAGDVYAIIRSSRPVASAFAVIRDERETTVVVEEKKAPGRSGTDYDGGWRRITFDMVLPFDLVGFFARVSEAMASVGIPIFALSTYSTDHLFIKEQHLESAVRTLRKLGLAVKIEEAGKAGGSAARDNGGRSGPAND